MKYSVWKTSAICIVAIAFFFFLDCSVDLIRVLQKGVEIRCYYDFAYFLYQDFNYGVYYKIHIICSALPFVLKISEERQNGVQRLVIIRYGSKKYVRVYMVKSILLGGVVCLMGFSLFCILLKAFGFSIFQPLSVNAEFFLTEPMGELLALSGLEYVLCFGGLMFFSGCYYATFSSMIAFHGMNRYVVLVSGYIYHYFLVFLEDLFADSDVFFWTQLLIGKKSLGNPGLTLAGIGIGLVFFILLAYIINTNQIKRQTQNGYF